MTQSNQESPAPAKDVGGIRTSSVEPSPITATTERTHGGQGQHVASEAAPCGAQLRARTRYESFHPSYCERPGIYGGRCKIHSAEADAKRRAKSQAAWDARIAVMQAPKLELAALRSRVAELEAALQDARDWIFNESNINPSAILAKIDAALSTTKGA